MLERGCTYQRRLMVLVAWSPGAFVIRHPVIHRPSSGCQHGPAPLTAGSSGAMLGLTLTGGWTTGLRGQHQRGTSAAEDMPSSMSLAMLPHGNIPEHFSLWKDFLVWARPIASSPFSGLDCPLWFTKTQSELAHPKVPGDRQADAFGPSLTLAVRHLAGK